jgi:hypothetical protein
MEAVELGDPQSLNLYAYCGNDPINHVDPDGLFFKKLFGTIGKVFMWVAIAATIAMAVLTVAPGAWAGTWLAKISIWSAKHQILSSLIGLHSPKFIISGLASLGAKVATGAFWAFASVGAVNSLMAAASSSGSNSRNVGKPDPERLSARCRAILSFLNTILYTDKRRTKTGGPHGLIYRFWEQIHGKNGPGTRVWKNHEKEIKILQSRLRESLKNWKDDNCGPPSPGAWRLATRPSPTPKQWLDRNNNWKSPYSISAGDVLTGAAAGAGAYGIYRVIRLLPSFLPPLWPTIGPNLVIP